MRLFFAVLLPDNVCAATARAQEHLRAALPDGDLRWVAPEQFHLTLKFLGETTEEAAARAVDAARAAAAVCAPFTLGVGGVGAFPHERRPELFWAGVTEGLPDLAGLSQYLDKALDVQGFSCETRRFRAHLTLARLKRPERSEAVGRAFSASIDHVDRIGAFMLNSFVLMRSELCPSGPIYSLIETFPLSKAQRDTTG